jgi:hypothetical protein
VVGKDEAHQGLVRNISANFNGLGVQAFGLVSVSVCELDEAEERQRICLGTANVMRSRQCQRLRCRLSPPFSITTEARESGALA